MADNDEISIPVPDGSATGQLIPDVTINEEPLEDDPPPIQDIVPDGDVILQLPGNMCIRVSSAVLLIASEYFRIMLTKGWAEGLAGRSAADPLVMRFGTDKMSSSAAHHLFCLLHHKLYRGQQGLTLKVREGKLVVAEPITAQHLLNLALTAEYAQCEQALVSATEGLFCDFAAPIVRDATDMQSLVNIVSAAYLLRQARWFTLFTKRLITDHTDDLANAKWHDSTKPALRRILSSLESMSDIAWNDMTTRFKRLAVVPFLYRKAEVVCCRDAADELMLQRITNQLLPPASKWPESRTDGITMRQVLSGLYSLPSLEGSFWCKRDQQRTLTTLKPDDLARLCAKVDESVSGLCFCCTKCDVDCTCADAGKHSDVGLQVETVRASTSRWTQGDSFIIVPAVQVAWEAKRRMYSRLRFSRADVERLPEYEFSYIGESEWARKKEPGEY